MTNSRAFGSNNFSIPPPPPPPPSAQTFGQQTGGGIASAKYTGSAGGPPTFPSSGSTYPPPVGPPTGPPTGYTGSDGVAGGGYGAPSMLNKGKRMELLDVGDSGPVGFNAPQLHTLPPQYPSFSPAPSPLRAPTAPSMLTNLTISNYQTASPRFTVGGMSPVTHVYNNADSAQQNALVFQQSPTPYGQPLQHQLASPSVSGSGLPPAPPRSMPSPIMSSSGVRRYDDNSNDGYRQQQQQLQPSQQANLGHSSSSGNMRRSTSRIDPSQMPRPPRPQTDVIFHTRSGSGRRVPPLSNTGFMAVDTGNCSPRYMRITTCAPPISREVQEKVGIPVAIVATPFASPENGEEEVPMTVMDNGQAPPRCTRCRGYINPSVQWLNNGNSWGCNLCGMNNAVPDW